jgi:hypothetical protein
MAQREFTLHNEDNVWELLFRVKCELKREGIHLLEEGCNRTTVTLRTDKKVPEDTKARIRQYVPEKFAIDYKVLSEG